MKIEFSKADTGDISEILQIEKKVFTDAWSERDIKSAVESPNSICYKAKVDGVICAYVLGNKILPEGEIYRIATALEYRNMGIGRALLSHLIENEKSRGLSDLFLEFRESNEAAEKLYTGCGFNKISIRKNYYKKPTENAVNMHLSVGGRDR